MHCVVLAQVLLGELSHFEADELEALFFETGQDAADEATLGGVGLEEDEGAFHGADGGKG